MFDWTSSRDARPYPTAPRMKRPATMGELVEDTDLDVETFRLPA
jgi:hypothetical protein